MTIRRTVKRVLDGDTFQTYRKVNGSNYVRIAGVNAPELNPTEHVWAYLKAHELKTHQAQNTEELKHLTKRKMQSIQRRKDLIHSFFI